MSGYVRTYILCFALIISEKIFKRVVSEFPGGRETYFLTHTLLCTIQNFYEMLQIVSILKNKMTIQDFSKQEYTGYNAFIHSFI